MKITTTNRQTWLNLFKIAASFRDLAPWTWMTDQDLFGIQDPKTGEVGYCCVMGAAAEVFALGVYYGEEGYFSYLNLLNLEDASDIDRIAAGLEQKVLKVEFVNRQEINKVDRAAFKELGLKFRGSNNWIQVRDHQAGYFPWYLSDEQAEYLTHALWQAIEVSERFLNDKELLEDEEGRILVRVPVKTTDGLVWKDEYRFEPDEEDENIRVRMPNSLLVQKAKEELERQKVALCLSLHYMPSVVKNEKGENRPYFAKMALWIAYGSSYILGFNIFTPTEFEQAFETHFFNKLHELKIIPQQIVVNSDMGYKILEPYATALEIELIYAPEIKDFQEVFSSMGEMLGGGFF